MSCSLPNKVYGFKILKKILGFIGFFFRIFRIFLGVYEDLFEWTTLRNQLNEVLITLFLIDPFLVLNRSWLHKYKSDAKSEAFSNCDVIF